MEENWENKIPIIESNCNVKFSLVHLLYTSDSHYTFCSFCSHHKCVEVINDPGGLTAPLRYSTHSSLKEKNNKEDGKLQCFLFFSFLFFSKRRPLFCFVHRHCSPRVRFPCHPLDGTTELNSRCQYLYPFSWKLEMYCTQDPEIIHLAQCSFICIYFNFTTNDYWCTSALDNQVCQLMTKKTSRCIFSQWAMKEDMELPIMLVNSPSIIIIFI